RIKDHAAELVNLNPDVILVAGRRAVPIVQQQTRSIPVVFVGISDPVASGLVASFARPGGNLTGFSQIEFSLIEKLVEGSGSLHPASPALRSFKIPIIRRPSFIRDRSKPPQCHWLCDRSYSLFTPLPRSSALLKCSHESRTAAWFSRRTSRL